ncbi:MAG TPA: hypothetical protein VJZ01_09325 [Lachnospiraceae bacterium]|nr:hypothetical protein [Lachnospiraceae bacterium]
MKKSGLIMICLALILTCLTGCVTEETRETILSEMQKEDIIKGDWENIGQDTGDAGPIPDISLYNYYYEDADEIIYAVTIYNSVDSEEEDDVYYPVTIYDNMEAYEAEELYTNDETEQKETRMVTKYRHTDETTYTQYEVYKQEILWFEVWKVEVVEE